MTICTFVIKIMLKIVSVTVVDGTLVNPSSNSSYSQPGVHGQKSGQSLGQIQSKRSVDPCMLHGRLSIMGAPMVSTIKSSERFVGIFKFFRIFAEVNFLKSENSSQLYNQIIIRSRWSLFEYSKWLNFYAQRTNKWKF